MMRVMLSPYGLCDLDDREVRKKPRCKKCGAVMRLMSPSPGSNIPRDFFCFDCNVFGDLVWRE